MSVEMSTAELREKIEALHELCGDPDVAPVQWIADRIGVSCRTVYNWGVERGVPEYALTCMRLLEENARLRQELGGMDPRSSGKAIRAAKEARKSRQMLRDVFRGAARELEELEQRLRRQAGAVEEREKRTETEDEAKAMAR